MSGFPDPSVPHLGAEQSQSRKGYENEVSAVHEVRILTVSGKLDVSKNIGEECLYSRKLFMHCDHIDVIRAGPHISSEELRKKIDKDPLSLPEPFRTNGKGLVGIILVDLFTIHET